MVGQPDHCRVALQALLALAHLLLGHLFLLRKLGQARVEDGVVPREDVGENVAQTRVGSAPAVVLAHKTRRRVGVRRSDQDARVSAGVKALCRLARRDHQVWERKVCRLVRSALFGVEIPKTSLSPLLAHVPVGAATSWIFSNVLVGSLGCDISSRSF